MKIGNKVLAIVLFLAAFLHLAAIMGVTAGGAVMSFEMWGFATPEGGFSRELLALAANFSWVVAVHGAVMAMAGVWAWQNRSAAVSLGIVYGIGILTAGLVSMATDLALSMNWSVILTGALLLAAGLWARMERSSASVSAGSAATA